MRTFKIVQKRLYDALSHRHSVLLCFVGFVLILVSAFHFGETALDWSREKYQAVFNSYRDNIAQKSYQRLLCQYVPIDAVYTWVNGSDPNLLTELFKTRHKLAQELNITNVRDRQCTYSHCIPSHLVLVQPLVPRSVTLDDLQYAEPLLENITGIFRVQSKMQDHLQNFTVLVFDSLVSAQNLVSKGSFQLGFFNFSLTRAYVTDEWMAHTAVLLDNMFLISGVPPGHTQEEILKVLPPFVENVFLQPDNNLAIVTVKVTERSGNFTSHNLTLDKKLLKILPAYLVLEPLSKDEDASSNRFADNEELRYSLRSLEKHAPWIRHIYLVTNGQIPSWLNLDNPRISIVTHQELFRNSSHLPTFSSPAIECHLHRIPGLSEKFLYLNDDVFLGKDVWPEDFYSYSKGHKVYLSWPVPDCAEGCPSSWIRDGYCDKTCNNSGCDWDGGDCKGDNVKFSYPQHNRGNYMYAHQALMENLDKMYCNPSCANSWLADRYCDQACNVRTCGYDAGDCGTGSYGDLHQIHFVPSKLHYELPAGEIAAYMNLSSMIANKNLSVESGSYSESEAVRSIAISIKFSILTLVLHSGHGPTNISISLTIEEKEISFILSVDTKPVASLVTVLPLSSTIIDNSSQTTTTTTEPSIPPANVTRYPPDKWFPKIVIKRNQDNSSSTDMKISSMEFPAEIKNELENLKSFYTSGLLTKKGYEAKQKRLVSQYLKNQRASEMLTGNRSSTEILYHPSAYIENSVQHRSLKWIDDLTSRNSEKNRKLGFLPWEKDGSFLDIEQKMMSKSLQSNYISNASLRGRHLLDTFGDSLRHVNRLYNAAFGYEARKVPAHMAHLVDVKVMDRLQEKFSVAFDETSSHKIRSSGDMQFAFSYYYYLMSEMENVTIDDIFDQFDTDNSGTLSDREIRTLLTRVNDLPLQFSNVMQFEDSISNCSMQLGLSLTESLTAPAGERYADSTLPTISKALISQCLPVRNNLLERFGHRRRNRFELLGEEEVSFKMLHSNLSIVLASLDEIRKIPKKFICLNDNIGHGTKDADIIQAVLKDFYESLFPIPSQFELPAEYRNRFLNMHELERWRRFRSLVRIAACSLIVALFCAALCAICRPERFLSRGSKRFFRREHRVDV